MDGERALQRVGEEGDTKPPGAEHAADVGRAGVAAAHATQIATELPADEEVAGVDTAEGVGEEGEGKSREGGHGRGGR